MKNIDFKNVNLKSGYFKSKELLNRKITINAVYDRFYDSGRIEAFDFNWRECMGKSKMPHFFWDSDVAKWIEGAANILAKEKDAELESKIESLIDKIEKHMCDDGYFNIYFTVVEPSKRFFDRNLHELYCAGHLIEASVSYYEATGKDRFLKLMCRYADYIYKVFYAEDSANFRTPGHEEIELALFRLYKCTGNKKYFELMEFFLKQRGSNEKDTHILGSDFYAQDDTPTFKHTEAKGHAVRAMYLYSAVADYAKETGDISALQTCKAIFDDVVHKKMYITGGIGTYHIGECFTKQYDLPADTAYSETCAAIGLKFFSQRMLELENNSFYADITEKLLYNGIMSGLSLDGKGFFYENPLEINLKKRNRVYGDSDDRYPITQRPEIFGCSCCPPNLNRVLSSLGGCVFGVEGKTLYVNQYAECNAEFNNIKVSVKTEYPKNGVVTVRAEGTETVAFRIPSWCKKFDINSDYTLKNGYAFVKNTGKEIIVSFEIKPFFVKANPLVYDISGKCAIQRGPVVYCVEGVDNKCESLHSIFVDKEIKYKESADEKLGTVLDIDGYMASCSSLYTAEDYEYEKTKIRFIPYHSFANRGESDMLVWINVK